MKLATLCYIERQNKILMMHRTKRVGDLFKDFWNGIGGKLKDSESPEECAIREVKEETGLTITKPTLKGILTFPNNRDTGEVWYVFVYTVKHFKGNLKENEEGTLHWIEKKDLSKLNIQKADKHFTKWLDLKKIFSAKFYYEGDTLVDYQVSFYKN